MDATRRLLQRREPVRLERGDRGGHVLDLEREVMQAGSAGRQELRDRRVRGRLREELQLRTGEPDEREGQARARGRRRARRGQPEEAAVPLDRRVEVGRVTAYEPGRRIAMAWRLPFWPDGGDSELEIRFTPLGADGTRVDLAHDLSRSLLAPERLASYGSGWHQLLGYYQEHCTTTAA